MSRKDTIIIAVLINAGLLIVLFATALKPSDSKEEEFVTALAPVAAVPEMPLGAPQQTPQDEVGKGPSAVFSAANLGALASCLEFCG